MYGQHLEANLQALHDRLHRLSSRPQPVRWVEILKDNGRSPLLLNVALHGMEHALGTSYTPRGVTRGTYAVVRYADDFAVFCPMQAQAIEARSLLATWLKARGLKLSDAKTHIRHLQEGFNF